MTSSGTNRVPGRPGIDYFSRHPDSCSTSGGSGKTLASLQLLQARLEEALAQLDQLVAERSVLKQRIAAADKLTREAVRYAFRDELTGLANRRLLNDRFNQAKSSRARDKGAMGLMFVDIDGFKQINDIHGHLAGDRLLRKVSACLLSCARTSDTVCRYGGDELLVLLPQIIDTSCVESLARRFRDELDAVSRSEAWTIGISVSIGISVYPLDSARLSGLIDSADKAMYREKAGKRGAAPLVVSPLHLNGESAEDGSTVDSCRIARIEG